MHEVNNEFSNFHSTASDGELLTPSIRISLDFSSPFKRSIPILFFTLLPVFFLFWSQIVSLSHLMLLFQSDSNSRLSPADRVSVFLYLCFVLCACSLSFESRERKKSDLKFSNFLHDGGRKSSGAVDFGEGAT
jgi:hypothetical protein